VDAGHAGLDDGALAGVELGQVVVFVDLAGDVHLVADGELGDVRAGVPDVYPHSAVFAACGLLGEESAAGGGDRGDNHVADVDDVPPVEPVLLDLVDGVVVLARGCGVVVVRAGRGGLRLARAALLVRGTVRGGARFCAY
jgi:hypothetical protein